MVIGESDTGKTTLVTAIANTLRARRPGVAVIDADLGQSEIGPPTTIGLGRIRRRVGRLADADVVALYIVGVTSPARHLLRVVVGTRRMATSRGPLRPSSQRTHRPARSGIRSRGENGRRDGRGEPLPLPPAARRRRLR